MTTFDSQSREDDSLLTFYGRVHPEYDDMLPHWRFCQSTYTGGPRWFAENIFRYHKEGEEEFKARVARAYRPNHTREVVDLVQKYIFKAEIRRDESAPQVVQNFWKHATRSGQSVDDLMGEVSTGSAIAQRVAVVVDSAHRAARDEDGTELAISEAEAEEAHAPIYAYVVMPWDILDYSFNETDGQLNWIKLREYVRDDADPLHSTGETTERIRLWTRSEWLLFTRRNPETKGGKEQVIIEAAGVHNLGEVPVRLVDHASTSNRYRASGLVDDIAYLDRTIANYLSNLDAIIQDQTFSQLAIPAEALPADHKGAKSNMIDMGTKRIFTYSAGVGSHARPEYLSPDPKQAGVIMDAINKNVVQIYSSIGMAGERTKQDNAVGIDNSSGVAKAYDFERINSLLLSKSKRLQAVENWLARMARLWSGEQVAEESDLVTYPDSFDVATLGDELVTAEALQKIGAPIEVRRQQMHEIVLRLFPDVDDKTWKRLKAAVEKWEDNPPLQPPPTGSDKPAAAPSRQGSVTSSTASTPKVNAK